MSELLNRIRAESADLAKRLSLPFRSVVWRGAAGGWSGSSSGASIDFEDHRAYQPGDDVRNIDWNAFARTNQYIMKQYREEVSPTVEIVFDSSRSMQVNLSKRQCSLRLLYFAIASARRSGAALRCFVLRNDAIERVHEEELSEARLWADAAPSIVVPNLQRIPWSSSGLRIVISDLLFPAAAHAVLKPLTTNRGRSVVFAPFVREEVDPDWEGQIEFVDCETDRVLEQRIDSVSLARYHEAYRRHFSLWEAYCRGRGIAFARVDANLPFESALQQSSGRVGAVEVTK